jgi:hypothetical protein
LGIYGDLVDGNGSCDEPAVVTSRLSPDLRPPHGQPGVYPYLLARETLFDAAGTDPAARCHRCRVSFVSSLPLIYFATRGSEPLAPATTPSVVEISCPLCGTNCSVLNVEHFQLADGGASVIGPDPASRRQVLLALAQKVVDGELTVEEAAEKIRHAAPEWGPVATWMVNTAPGVVLGILTLVLSVAAFRLADAGAAQPHVDMQRLQTTIQQQDSSIRDLLQQLVVEDAPTPTSDAPQPLPTDTVPPLTSTAPREPPRETPPAART